MVIKVDVVAMAIMVISILICQSHISQVSANDGSLTY